MLLFNPMRTKLIKLNFTIGLMLLATWAGLWLKISRNKLPAPSFEINYTAGAKFGNAVLPLSKQDKIIKLVVLGDSTVEGIGATSAKTSLAGQIAEKSASKLQIPIHVSAFGRRGARIADVINHQIKRIDPAADVVVVEVGSNDVIHLTDLDAIQPLTEQMIIKLKAVAPDAQIIIGSAGTLNSPIFGLLRPLAKKRATQVRSLQEAACKKHGASFMDVAKDVDNQYSKTSGSAASDNFHPSDVGYEIWARPLAALVIRALEK